MSSTLDSAASQHVAPLLAAAAELRGLGLFAPGGAAGLSVRLDSGRFVFTDGARAGGDASIVEVGSPASTAGAPLHAALFANRPQVNAIAHCSPVHVTALALRGITVAQCVCGDPIASLDESRAGALVAAVVELSTAAELMSLGRLGLLALGGSLAQVVDRVQAAEHAARITHAARQLGPGTFGSERRVAAMRAAASTQGWGDNPSGCDRCNACELGHLRQGGEQPSASVEAALDRFLRP